MSPGELTSFILYTLTVAFSIGAIGDLFTDFMRAAGAADRVFALLDRTPSIPLVGGERPAAIAGRIALEEVELRYPTRPEVVVLDRLSLASRARRGDGFGRTVGQRQEHRRRVGAAPLRPHGGAGHSRRPRSARSLDATWLRQQIGVVGQEPTLLSTSILENIRYGRPEASKEEVVEAARAANALEFIDGFPEGLQTLVGERGAQLSGGQKQRVAIARALLKNPSILILDEATSALDAESEHLVKLALDRLQEGRTTLVIAHRLSTVKGADRVAVVAEGKVAQLGSHDALMKETEGLYRRLVERQFVAA